MNRKDIFDVVRKLKGSLSTNQVKAGDLIMDAVGEEVMAEFLGMESGKSVLLTVDKLKKIYPTAKAEFVDEINSIAPRYGINTKERMAMFLAQVLHESNGFNSLRESLNYKPERLLAVFPKYVKSLDQAKKLVNAGQVAIGDCVYGGRMGNGTNNGDGYKYRGGGFMHTTGKTNYTIVNQNLQKSGLKIDLVANPELIVTPAIAVESGMIFWRDNNLNAHADRKDVTSATKVINGGSNGLAERKKLYDKAMSVL